MPRFKMYVNSNLVKLLTLRTQIQINTHKIVADDVLSLSDLKKYLKKILPGEQIEAS